MIASTPPNVRNNAPGGRDQSRPYNHPPSLFINNHRTPTTGLQNSSVTILLACAKFIIHLYRYVYQASTLSGRCQPTGYYITSFRTFPVDCANSTA
ncbi:MAG TPA: hypothetical protein VFA41_12555 [Ktedonobacteraceae bacterium]|nr:hypothetical protein [Ktedonobacteraceae bacterium]